jgi:hypothetical protein
MVAVEVGLISPEAAGVPWRNDKIDRAIAALRADKLCDPFANREIRTMTRRLFARTLPPD